MSHYTPRNFTLPADYCFRGDPRDPAESAADPYIFSREAVIAVDVALATGRPLLVAGPPGCGKSRLAETMAAVLRWNFVYQTITSRTRLEQLTVEVDHLRRLNDAHLAARSTSPHALADRDEEYYNPGIFWWAFDAHSARRRGLPESVARPRSEPRFPGVERKPPDEAREGTVLLLDEIDKAEPDLPNDLLEPLDRGSFGLPDGRTLRAQDGAQRLTVITTNRERELPPAFVRRCVTLLLAEPSREALVAIAAVRAPQAEKTLVEKVADRIEALRQELDESGRRPPGTSEFLDAVNTCQQLRIAVDSPDWEETWQQIELVTLRKPMVTEDERSRPA